MVSTVVHQLGVKVHSKIEGEKHLLAAAWECDKALVNFAPYGKYHDSISLGMKRVFGIYLEFRPVLIGSLSQKERQCFAVNGEIFLLHKQ